jgi:alpha-L-arabinofuranosidase
VKLVNRAGRPRTVRLRFNGLERPAPRIHATVLSHADPNAENTLDEPDRIVPAASIVPGKGAEFDWEVPGYSVTVLRGAPALP